MVMFTTHDDKQNTTSIIIDHFGFVAPSGTGDNFRKIQHVADTDDRRRDAAGRSWLPNGVYSMAKNSLWQQSVSVH